MDTTVTGDTLQITGRMSILFCNVLQKCSADCRSEQVIGVGDPVGVALFGEESLTMCRILRIESVARDHRIEVSLTAVVLGSQ